MALEPGAGTSGTSTATKWPNGRAMHPPISALNTLAATNGGYAQSIARRTHDPTGSAGSG